MEVAQRDTLLTLLTLFKLLTMFTLFILIKLLYALKEKLGCRTDVAEIANMGYVVDGVGG